MKSGKPERGWTREQPVRTMQLAEHEGAFSRHIKRAKSTNLTIY